MEVDFNALGTFGNNPENRLKIIQGVASEVALLGGLRSTVPAAEMIVQTIEKLALDGAVRHDMAARVRACITIYLAPTLYLDSPDDSNFRYNFSPSSSL